LKKVKLPLGPRSYEIRIGEKILAQALSLLDGKKRAFIVADNRLKEARADLLSALKSLGWEVEEIAVEAGEALKSIESMLPIYGELLKRRADRNSVLFALGGGSVGDAAGFVASTYMRGIAWVGIPTTLLAQVDSSVGGKTAVNYEIQNEIGKNLIGTTYQPSLVICDIHYLKTLSSREMVSGLGETIKYGIIYDPKFFAQLKKSWKNIVRRDSKSLISAIQKSVSWKSKIVAKDEHDRKGIREALNFGHTFGHALEASTRFELYQHGEAVIWGMRFALALSHVKGSLTKKKYRSVDDFLSMLEVPALPKSIEPQEIFDFMKKDKKMESGSVRFVLLSRLGRTFSDRFVSNDELHSAFRLMKGRS
jgi:3-dehydroquinate synthase